MGAARSLHQGMPAKPGTRVTRPLRVRIRWGNVARLAALLAAIPLFVVVLGGGDPPNPGRAEPAAPPAPRAPSDPPRARTPPPRPHRSAERRRHPRSHDRPSRTTGGDTSPPVPAPAAPAPSSPQGEEFAPG
jgi:hypothetical protein